MLVGVPQGSALSHLQYNLHTIDLDTPQFAQTELTVYAFIKMQGTVRFRGIDQEVANPDKY